MQDYEKIKRELWIHRIISVSLAAVIVAGAFGLLFFKEGQHAAEVAAPTSPQELPFYEKVMASIEPLEYSGLPDMIRPDVTLSIDFDHKSWTLHNLHKFGSNGEVLLDHDRYGLCGELAAHVYREVAPLFKDRYVIQFLRAAESGFFLRPFSSHIVLVFTDKTNGERYFLDPSFHRYGKETDFEDYLFFEAVDSVTHFESMKPDVSFAADSGTPLLIRKNFLLYLTIEAIDGKFDKDNFVIALTATKRYKYSGRYIFALRVQDGKPQVFRNKWLLDRFLTPEESQGLLSKLALWFEQYVGPLVTMRSNQQIHDLTVLSGSEKG